jgi:2',3'-cyclic-nucleotide 2'-phosphodiesterase (5'-nucleotidase family)
MPAVGGVARRATKIADERKTGKPVLVLDAGNSLIGDQDPAQRSAGASSIEALNLLGYDAMALGPADLTLGPKVLRERIAEASFAILSVNAIDQRTGELVAKPYVVREIGGHRVAILGLSGAVDTSEIRVRDPLSSVKDAVAAVRSQYDEIIVLSNAGASVNQQIADGVEGITAIVGGGSGASAKPWVGRRTGTPVFHADEASPGHAGRVLGVARLEFDHDGALTDFAWKQFPLGPEVPDDATMADWVRTKTGG